MYPLKWMLHTGGGWGETPPHMIVKRFGCTTIHKALYKCIIQLFKEHVIRLLIFLYSKSKFKLSILRNQLKLWITDLFASLLGLWRWPWQPRNRRWSVATAVVYCHRRYIYIYPKRLTLLSGYTFFCQYVCSLGIESTTFCAVLYHWATGTVHMTSHTL